MTPISLPTRKTYTLTSGQHSRMEDGVFRSYKAGADILLSASEARRLGARVRAHTSISADSANPWVSVVQSADSTTLLTLISSLDSRDDVIQIRAAETSYLDREEVIEALANRERELVVATSAAR